MATPFDKILGLSGGATSPAQWGDLLSPDSAGAVPLQPNQRAPQANDDIGLYERVIGELEAPNWSHRQPAGNGRFALGRFGILNTNLPEWSRQALGREVTEDEFIGNPEVQRGIFRRIFGDYVQQHGPEGAALRWFTGTPTPSEGHPTDNLGTHWRTYLTRFRAAMAQANRDPNWGSQPGQGSPIVTGSVGQGPRQGLPQDGPQTPMESFFDAISGTRRPEVAQGYLDVLRGVPTSSQLDVRKQRAAFALVKRMGEIAAEWPGATASQIASLTLQDRTYATSNFDLGASFAPLLIQTAQALGRKPVEYQNVAPGGSMVPIDPNTGAMGQPWTAPSPRGTPTPQVLSPGQAIAVPDQTAPNGYRLVEGPAPRQEGRTIAPGQWALVPDPSVTEETTLPNGSIVPRGMRLVQGPPEGFTLGPDQTRFQPGQAGQGQGGPAVPVARGTPVDPHRQPMATNRAEILQKVFQDLGPAQQELSILARLQSELQDFSQARGPDGEGLWPWQAFLSRYGINLRTTGNQEQDNLNAINALLDRLTPAQRQGLPGAASDRDVSMFRGSLPQLVNSVEGNARIMAGLIALAQRRVESGQIAAAALQGKVDPVAAMSLLGAPRDGMQIEHFQREFPDLPIRNIPALSRGDLMQLTRQIATYYRSLGQPVPQPLRQMLEGREAVIDALER